MLLIHSLLIKCIVEAILIHATKEGVRYLRILAISPSNFRPPYDLKGYFFFFFLFVEIMTSYLVSFP